MRLREAKTISDDVKLSLLTSEIITDTLELITQTHVWHWQTKAFAAHKALGDYYEFLQDTVDTLAETFLGNGGGLLKPKRVELSIDYDKQTVVKAIKDFRDKLNQAQSDFMDKENAAFNGVGDIILDIVKESDKLLYLLELE